MSGLEFVGSIASVAQLAGTVYTISKTLYEVGNALSNAPSDIKDLAGDLERFSEELHLYARLLDKKLYDDQFHSLTASIIEECATICTKIDRVLRKLRSGKLWARVKWLYKEKEILKLLTRLRDLKLSLLSVLQLMKYLKADHEIDAIGGPNRSLIQASNGEGLSEETIAQVEATRKKLAEISIAQKHDSSWSNPKEKPETLLNEEPSLILEDEKDLGSRPTEPLSSQALTGSLEAESVPETIDSSIISDEANSIHVAAFALPTNPLMQNSNASIQSFYSAFSHFDPGTENSHLSTMDSSLVRTTDGIQSRQIEDPQQRIDNENINLRLGLKADFVTSAMKHFGMSKGAAEAWATASVTRIDLPPPGAVPPSDRASSDLSKPCWSFSHDDASSLPLTQHSGDMLPCASSANTTVSKNAYYADSTYYYSTEGDQAHYDYVRNSHSSNSVEKPSQSVLEPAKQSTQLKRSGSESDSYRPRNYSRSGAHLPNEEISGNLYNSALGVSNSKPMQIQSCRASVAPSLPPQYFGHFTTEDVINPDLASKLEDKLSATTGGIYETVSPLDPIDIGWKDSVSSSKSMEADKASSGTTTTSLSTAVPNFQPVHYSPVSSTQFPKRSMSQAQLPDSDFYIPPFAGSNARLVYSDLHFKPEDEEGAAHYVINGTSGVGETSAPKPDPPMVLEQSGSIEGETLQQKTNLWHPQPRSWQPTELWWRAAAKSLLSDEVRKASARDEQGQSLPDDCSFQFSMTEDRKPWNNPNNAAFDPRSLFFGNKLKSLKDAWLEACCNHYCLTGSKNVVTTNIDGDIARTTVASLERWLQNVGDIQSGTPLHRISEILKVMRSTLDFKIGGLIWTCFCQVIVSLIENHPDDKDELLNSTFTNLADLATLIARYNVMESMYHDWPGMTLEKQYEDSLINLCMIVLQYLDKVQEQSWWPWSAWDEEDELKAYAAKIADADTACRGFTVTIVPDVVQQDRDRGTKRTIENLEDVEDSGEDSDSTLRGYDGKEISRELSSSAKRVRF